MSNVSLGPTPFPELTHIMIGLESCSFLVRPTALLSAAPASHRKGMSPPPHEPHPPCSRRRGTSLPPHVPAEGAFTSPHSPPNVPAGGGLHSSHPPCPHRRSLHLPNEPPLCPCRRETSFPPHPPCPRPSLRTSELIIKGWRIFKAITLSSSSPRFFDRTLSLALIETLKSSLL